MPSREKKKRKEKRERYSGTINQNSPRQDSDQAAQLEQSDSYSYPHTQNSPIQDFTSNTDNPCIPSSSGRFTFSEKDIEDNELIEGLVEPLTPLSISSETCVPRKIPKTHDSSIESMDTISVTSSLESLSEIPQISSISSSKKVGPPKRKGVGGRQKKDIHSHIETVEPTVTGPRNIDFSTLNTLEFATAKTYEPSICSRTVMPLYERDSEKLGPRFIETMWNNLSTWLNDAFIFPYLCYLAKISGRKTIVVDPLITDPTVQQNKNVKSKF
ncbi:unnamed protein product [Meloidogyne enterolobii]|uniref:Uncharacterized protein n=1 Tax=Meloidogyne enterolobii TaxID=390850 RepID=A0ACB0YF77_MELEN